MADAIVKEAQERFEDCVEYESENRSAMLDDMAFVDLPYESQWPQTVREEREREKRPCLVSNRLPAFIRQVVNDCRQNRPSIKVSPVDSQADPQTAEVLSGIIRHIERNSNADAAYDTAVESAVKGGLGYFTIGTAYASDDGFDQELTIDRVVYPFSIYGDCDSEAVDSSDWRYAFHCITGPRAVLEKRYGTEIHSWKEGSYGDKLPDEGTDDVRIARYWSVEEDKKLLLMLSNGAAILESDLDDDLMMALQAQQIGVVEGRSREIVVPRVVLRVLDSEKELEEAQPWAGRYIPIVPVYGNEFWHDGKRRLKSLISDAKDSARMVNYWKTASTELVALAPKAPWVGPEGFAKAMPHKWRTANTANHAFLEYKEVPSGRVPERQPFAGVPAGALQEAMNAGDDIKAILGMFDASLGARSNEVTGRAIEMRQREGDVSQMHFMDNLVRAIRHGGRILVDLIPRIYDAPRIVRIVGEDGTTDQVKINEEYETQDETGAAIIAMHDVRVGKYDINVSAGPSFTTQRQEAAAQMTEMVRAFPDAAPVIGDLIAKNLDWPGADEIAKRLQKLVPGNEQDGQQQAQMMQMQQQAEMQKLQADLQMKQLDAQMKQQDVRIKELELEAKKIDAQARVLAAQQNSARQLIPQ